MNEKERQSVDKIKRKIKRKNSRTPFTETKFFKTLTTDPVDYIINKVVLYMLEKEELKKSKQKKEKLLKEGFTGDPNNYDDVVRYEQAIGSEPIESYQDDDGVWTHTWPDGNKVRVKVTLSSIFPTKEQEDDCLSYIEELNKKREFCEYLGLTDDEISKLSWQEIDEKILEKKKSKIKVKSIFK